MGLADDLRSDVRSIFATSWQEPDGQKVPEAEDVRLGNDAVKLDATVLYADLVESTGLVDSYKTTFAAEVYKSYLHCALRIIRDEGGVATAFDGDRVMAVFIGASKNTTAARCALKISYAVTEIINPLVKTAVLPGFVWVKIQWSKPFVFKACGLRPGFLQCPRLSSV